MLLHPLRPHLRITALGLTLTSTSLYALNLHRARRPLLCEPSSPLDSITQQYFHTSTSGSTTTKAQGSPDSTSRIIRQLSLGSVVGVLGGVAVSAFSKVLAALIGMGVVVVQFAASKGYNIIPVGMIQRYVKGINLRRAVEENPAFKLSFGLTFALASMAKF